MIENIFGSFFKIAPPQPTGCGGNSFWIVRYIYAATLTENVILLPSAKVTIK